MNIEFKAGTFSSKTESIYKRLVTLYNKFEKTETIDKLSTDYVELAKEEKITVAFENDGSTNSNRVNKIEVAVDNIMSLEDEIIRRTGELAGIRRDVFNVISEVKDSKLRTLLTLRYISGKPFKYIAEKLRNSNGDPYDEHHVAHRVF